MDRAALTPQQQAGAAALMALLCVSAASCERDEACDWRDNDGDGIIDEGFDQDGDGHWACGLTEAQYNLGAYDCDDTKASVNTGGTEVCNGLDDDCDGTLDPGCGEALITTFAEVKGITVLNAAPGGGGELLIHSEWSDGSHNRSSLLRALYDSQGGLSFFPEQQLEDWEDILAVVPDTLNEDGLTDFTVVAESWLVAYVAAADGTYAYTLDCCYLIYEDLLETSLWFSQASGARIIDRTTHDGAQLGILVGGRWAWKAEVNTYTYLRNDEGWYELTGSWGWPTERPVVATYSVDLDADGQSDQVLVSKDIAGWRYAGLDEAFTAAFDADIADAHVADLDADGDPDLVLSVPLRRRIIVLINDGGVLGREQKEIAVDMRHPGAFLPHDVNGDGAVDLIIGAEDEAFAAVYLSNGLGVFVEACRVSLASVATTMTALPGLGAAQPTVVLIGQAGGQVSALTGLCEGAGGQVP